jgi:hypothetical protein
MAEARDITRLTLFVPGTLKTIGDWSSALAAQKLKLSNDAVWRLGPEGGRGTPQAELRPVFIPALVALLLALEKKNGKPLTREQVQQATGRGACIMMEQADAQVLERSRGYADLEPELAWEQWSEFRAANPDEV